MTQSTNPKPTAWWRTRKRSWLFFVAIRIAVMVITAHYALAMIEVGPFVIGKSDLISHAMLSSLAAAALLFFIMAAIRLTKQHLAASTPVTTTAENRPVSSQSLE